MSNIKPAGVCFLALWLTLPGAYPEGWAPGPPDQPEAEHFVSARRKMVEEQLVHPSDGRIPLRDQRVIEIMQKVPRQAFVPKRMQKYAYADRPLPIGKGQTISQPYIVGLMTELLQVSPDSKVLEIGTGSGYQAAVLAHLTPHVFSIEIDKDLFQSATQNLSAQGYHSVKLLRGDGHKGWPEYAPYDRIIVTCATAQVPQALLEQLKPSGRLVIPLGKPYLAQNLTVIKKDACGKISQETIIPVAFVPMTREQ